MPTIYELLRGKLGNPLVELLYFLITTVTVASKVLPEGRHGKGFLAVSLRLLNRKPGDGRNKHLNVNRGPLY